MLQRYRGIEGLEGRAPVGAAVTIGIKGPSGAPINTDRFYFVLPQDVKVGKHAVRPQHPAFKVFNEADAAKRTMLRGNLVHTSREDCFAYNLRAQVLAPLDKWPAHPQKRPACVGDGKTANRYYGGDDFREIKCPHELCEFRQGQRKLCKPYGLLLWRPRWSDGISLPTPLTKLTTASWYSISALLGFFDYIHAQATALGLTSYSLYGLPFTITLNRKTKPQESQAFPVMSFSPEVDLVAFFLAQREAHAKLSGGEMLALPDHATVEDLSDDSSIASDLAAITPGNVIAKPANGPDETLDAEVLPETDWRSEVRELAEAKGINSLQLDLMLGAPLSDAPDGAELEIRKKIAEAK